MSKRETKSKPQHANEIPPLTKPFFANEAFRSRKTLVTEIAASLRQERESKEGRYKDFPHIHTLDLDGGASDEQVDRALHWTKSTNSLKEGVDYMVWKPRGACFQFEFKRAEDLKVFITAIQG